MLVFNVNDHSNVPFIFRTVRVHFSAHHLLTDDFQRFLSTIFFVFLWFPAKGTYNMADNTSGPSVVNFWTMLKVRDIASARPVARPIIVRFWYYLLIIFFTFSTLATASGVQDASCRLSPRPRRSPRGNAIPTRPQASPCPPRSGRPPLSPRPRRCRSAGSLSAMP